MTSFVLAECTISHASPSPLVNALQHRQFTSVRPHTDFCGQCTDSEKLINAFASPICRSILSRLTPPGRHV